MKILFSTGIFILMCISCGHAQNTPIQQHLDSTTTNVSSKVDSTPVGSVIPDVTAENFSTSYATLRKQINTKRIRMYQDYLNASTKVEKNRCLDSASHYLHQVLRENILPYWYGTAWDFNGTTDKPQQGKIACGYFVSTTLKHSGFVLNRYKLAQQYSHSIVNSLGSDVKKFTTIASMLSYVESQPNNLYVVGLDNHVGFISKEDTSIQFIHSSFVGASCVVSEEASESAVLASSHLYVLGNLTSNAQIIMNWLKGATIEIVP